ncbi:MAG: hypothetical protein WC107_05610 [Patescibacteria group bacterium]|jgi:hypothetical protein
MKYLGHGFIPGVPARNLTIAEVKIYGKERLLASGLYIEKLSVKEKVKEVINDERN